MQKALESIGIKVGKRKLSRIYKFIGIRALYSRKSIYIKRMYRDMREKRYKNINECKGCIDNKVIVDLIKEYS